MMSSASKMSLTSDWLKAAPLFVVRRTKHVAGHFLFFCGLVRETLSRFLDDAGSEIKLDRLFSTFSLENKHTVRNFVAPALVLIFLASCLFFSA
jgi:hypothetical protein